MYRLKINSIFALALLLMLCATTASAQKKKATQKPKEKKEEVVDPLTQDYRRYCDEPILNVMFIDSIRTTLEDVVSEVKLPAHEGRLLTINGELAYENGFGDMRIFSACDDNGRQRLYKQQMLAGQWGEPYEVVIDDDFCDIRSPWLMVDGQTLYFSARRTPEERFALYTSGLDTGSGTFMKSQLLPCPLNGTSDDICYIQDDTDSIAWFVTSRNQPDGFVTLYTLKPHEPWLYYVNEDLSKSKLVSLARLSDIADTWTSAEDRANELQRIEDIGKDVTVKRQQEPLFVVDDKTVITDASQLTSATSKALMRRYVELNTQCQELGAELSELRQRYHDSLPSARSVMHSEILDAERRMEQLNTQITEIANELRQSLK